MHLVRGKIILIEARYRQMWYQNVQKMYWVHDVVLSTEAYLFLDHCFTSKRCIGEN